MMSGGKDSSGFIAYVKSVYPEISIQLVPYRDANTPPYMYDPLYTGCMPGIYGTTQLFACSDKYAEHLIGPSRYDFTGLFAMEECLNGVGILRPDSIVFTMYVRKPSNRRMT